MDINKVKQLALAVYNKQIPADYSLVTSEAALRDQLRELAHNFDSYRRNKLEIFEIIQAVVDDVAPKKILERIGMFAEVKSFGQGQRARFNKKLGRKNVKRFITKVGLGGVFERVRLDKEFMDVSTYARGGAVYIEFEQFLDGQMNWSELIDLIINGIEDEIYRDIQAALIAVFANLPAANKVSGASFDNGEMTKLVNTVGSYGGNANIICTSEFASTITPAANFIGDPERADMRTQGYIGKFMGANVIVLPQSFEDETNTVKVFDPSYAFVVPTGGSADEKIVKVALEGQTVVDEVKNADGSMEFSAYKKLGTIVLSTNHIGMYKNTSIV